jgi:hypothetical protein
VLITKSEWEKASFPGFPYFKASECIARERFLLCKIVRVEFNLELIQYAKRFFYRIAQRAGGWLKVNFREQISVRRVLQLLIPFRKAAGGAGSNCN